MISVGAEEVTNGNETYGHLDLFTFGLCCDSDSLRGGSRPRSRECWIRLSHTLGRVQDETCRLTLALWRRLVHVDDTWGCKHHVGTWGHGILPILCMIPFCRRRIEVWWWVRRRARRRWGICPVVSLRIRDDRLRIRVLLSGCRGLGLLSH